MISRFGRVACVLLGMLIFVGGSYPHTANALDTPNVLMGIDGMVMHASGLFRAPGSIPGSVADDGSNTFVFFSFSHFAGRSGRYKSFFLLDTNVDPNDPNNFGGISHNARDRVDTPVAFDGTGYSEVSTFDIDSDFYPTIDRGAFGQVFDPAEYQIEVKFKPILAADPFPVKNEAHTFNVGLDQIDGYVWDAEVERYKRANDAFTYTIGTEAVGINDWYATAPKDADGFATWLAPLTPLNAVGRGFYYDFGNNAFRTNNVVTGAGRTQNPDTTWSDANDGLDTLSFGGGATDPSRPNSQLRVPNGVPLISMASIGDGIAGAANPDETRVLSLEVKSTALKRIAPNSIMARIDSNSGLTFRFGAGLTYSTLNEANGTTPPPPTPINVPGAASFVPDITNQISRFDQNGMTNLVINPRTSPDPTNTGQRFFVRGAPGANAFDGTNAMVQVRAKLTEPLSNPGVAQSLTIYAKDLDGSDNTDPIGVGPITIPANPVGADEYNFILALSQFNTSTFTTVSVPLSSFTVNTMATAFANPGDGSRTEFNLYEFGALVPNASGLLRLELEYLQLVLPSSNNSDFNNDGLVNGTDFLIWQRGNGLTGQTNKANGDANGDGLVNGADLTIIKSKFGGAPAAAATGIVPEPTSGLLVIFAAAAFGLRRRSA